MRSILVTLALAAPLAAQTNAPISAADLKTRLYALAHDSMGGRATGSLGNFKAAEYVASEFCRFGLEPGGDHGTYFQSIPFFRFRPDESVSLSVDGVALQLGRDILPLAGAQVAFDHTPIVLGGTMDDSTTWIPSTAATGNVVVLTGPTTLAIGAALGRARAPRFATARLVLVALLDEVGGETTASILAGRVSTDTTRRGFAGPIVALVSRAVAERIAGTPGHQATGQLSYGHFPLPYPARNVVAILRGSDPDARNSYLALTGHNDHVGFDRSPVDHDSLRAFNRVIRPMGADSRFREPTADERGKIRTILDSLRAIRPPRLDSIRNGADDDGSGTVGLLEIAEQLSGRKPRLKRSVLFVSHAAEEEGLLGSAWFTDHSTVPIDSIVSETDMDMIGRGRSDDLPDAGPGYLEMIGMRRLSTEYGDIIDRVNARQKQPFVFNLTFDRPGHPLQYYCRADHYNYARYGVPAVALSRGEHLDYHQVTDEAEYIDYDALERVTRLVADIAIEIGNLDHRPKLDQPKGDPRAQCRQ